MTWYALTAPSRHELFARDRLVEARVGAVFLPFQRMIKRTKLPRRNVYTTKTVDEAVWPGYLFVETEPEFFDKIRRVRGVNDFVRSAGAPLALPPRLMGVLREVAGPDGLTQTRDISRLSLQLDWRKGDTFQFGPESPFGGLKGIIESLAKLDDTGELTAFMELFGRLTPVTLMHTDVENLQRVGRRPAS